MQGPLFQRYTHLLYWNVLSLGDNVNARRMSKPDKGSNFHIKNQRKILVIGIYYVNYQNYQNVMLSTSSDTKRPLMQTPRHPSKVYINIMKTTWYWVFIVHKLFLVIGSNSNGPGSNGPEWNDTESNDKRSKTRQRVKRQGVKIEKKIFYVLFQG